MNNRLKRVHDKKMTARCLIFCLVELDEVSLCENWDLVNPRTIHFSFSVLAKAIVNNINSTGSMMFPCLTPTLKSIYVSILMMMSLTTLLSYMSLIVDHSVGGTPYFPVWH